MGYGNLGCEHGCPFSGCQPERELPAVSVSGLVKPRCHCLQSSTIQLVMESRAMCRSKRFAKAAHLGEEGQELLGVRAHVSCGRGAHGPVVARRRQQLLAAGAAQLLLHRPVQAVPVRLIGQTVSCQCIDPGTVCV